MIWGLNTLLPANEVWGKAIFSQACVIPYVHRIGSDTTGYGRRAGGTHPTGMHSCLTMHPCFTSQIVLKY